MAEREIVIDGLTLTYEGLFSVKDIYSLIDTWLAEKGYDKREKKNYEIVKPDGKYIEIELEPWKKVTTYAKNLLNIKLYFMDVKTVEVEKDNIKMKLNQGKVHIKFNAFLETDYENDWEEKAIFYFLRSVFEKYIFKPFMSGFENGIRQDVMHLHDRIKSFLNLYRY